MAEKLTKTVLKEEIQRRIDWFERSFNFAKDMGYSDVSYNSSLCINFGRYRAYLDILWQIENGCFKGGYVS